MSETPDFFTNLAGTEVVIALRAKPEPFTQNTGNGQMEVPEFSTKIANTEPRPVSMALAVAKRVEASEGPERTGHKPLMRNPSADEPSRQAVLPAPLFTNPKEGDATCPSVHAESLIARPVGRNARSTGTSNAAPSVRPALVAAANGSTVGRGYERQIVARGKPNTKLVTNSNRLVLGESRAFIATVPTRQKSLPLFVSDLFPTLHGHFTRLFLRELAPAFQSAFATLCRKVGFDFGFAHSGAAFHFGYQIAQVSMESAGIAATREINHAAAWLKEVRKVLANRKQIWRGCYQAGVSFLLVHIGLAKVGNLNPGFGDDALRQSAVLPRSRGMQRTRGWLHLCLWVEVGVRVAFARSANCRINCCLFIRLAPRKSGSIGVSWYFLIGRFCLWHRSVSLTNWVKYWVCVKVGRACSICHRLSTATAKCWFRAVWLKRPVPCGFEIASFSWILGLSRAVNGLRYVFGQISLSVPSLERCQPSWQSRPAQLWSRLSLGLSHPCEPFRLWFEVVSYYATCFAAHCRRVSRRLAFFATIVMSPSPL